MSAEQPVIFYGTRGAPNADSDALRLLSMPTQFQRTGTSLRYDLALPASCIALLGEVRSALQQGAPTRSWPLAPFDPAGRILLADFLGQGEVVATVRDRFQIRETGLVGVWLGDRAGARTWSDGCWLEVGAIPAAIAEAADRLGDAPAAVPPQVLARSMNAAPLLHEIATRARSYHVGEPNHVINFTLLPLTEADSEILASALGSSGIALQSGGYGECRVLATNVRNVWAVQYLSAMGIVVLDTLEIGSVPQAVTAAADDFGQSAQRLDEMLASYRSERAS
jgi:hydrogenase-1 operon protein HyaF